MFPVRLSPGLRSFATTSRLDFKFKLTDEMVKKELEEKKLREKKEEPVQALHTKESPLIMGRVSSEGYKNIIKVGIPKHRLNELLLMYIRENDDIQVFDENNLCKPGDWILIRRLPVSLDPTVHHKVERVVYSYGNYVDPLTGRRSFGLYYDDDIRRLERIKVEVAS